MSILRSFDLRCVMLRGALVAGRLVFGNDVLTSFYRFRFRLLCSSSLYIRHSPLATRLFDPSPRHSTILHTLIVWSLRTPRSSSTLIVRRPRPRPRRHLPSPLRVFERPHSNA